MRNLEVLDCTLRDGGYCNDWNFGRANIQKIITCLQDANIDIVECGFLQEKGEYNLSRSIFTNLNQLEEFLPEDKSSNTFVVMVNYGGFNVDNLPNCQDTVIGGIRFAFHKKDRYDALEHCKKIKAKGYQVFIQPMVSMSYTDSEFLELINLSNNIDPFAFYIVDSFGVMKKKDLIRLFYLIDHNLLKNISVGYHSHNNMQLAYSNAQAIMQAESSRNMIIDSSIFGMGRGAGNLNTELFIEYCNNNFVDKYSINPLLVVIDEVLNRFYKQKPWGYSLPNYLSAKHNLHPNYAIYLSDKNTLKVEDIDEIFSMFLVDKKVNFDKSYISDLYIEYMAKNIGNEKHKEVLLIAPGKTSHTEIAKIKDFIEKKNVAVIAINFNYKEVETDFVFISNIRRYQQLEDVDNNKLIITSNIKGEEAYFKTKYLDLINNEESVKDNAGLMAIKMLMDFNLSKIYLAGFDGYSYNTDDNYYSKKLELISQNNVIDKMNKGMNKILDRYAEEIKIEFLTNPNKGK
jgi:4-hydroxy 2-oxovalerate aldolase